MPGAGGLRKAGRATAGAKERRRSGLVVAASGRRECDHEADSEEHPGASQHVCLR